MFEAMVTINNQTGLHARPATEFAKFCKNYTNEIELIKGETVTNPKSVISILSGGYTAGTEAKLVVAGDEAEKVGKEILEFLNTLKG